MTMPPPLLIGPLRIEFPILLAPMAGFTDPPFRGLCRREGCGLTFTEVANAEALTRGSKSTLHLLETSPGEHPVAAHIYGSKPDSMARAAAAIQKLERFDLIDINAGCPVRRIVAKGAGAALMRDPARLEAIVRAVRQATDLPVTVKTRIGTSPAEANTLDIARAVEQGGASALFLHARYASQQHNGKARWEDIRRVKEALSIPVVGNGGTQAPEDVLTLLRETGADGVMVGRAALGNPWFFAAVAHLLNGTPWTPPTHEERRAVLSEHLHLLIDRKQDEWKFRRRVLPPEHAAALQFRGHLFRYISGFKHSRAVARQLNSLCTVERVLTAVDSVLFPHPDEPAPPETP